MNPVEPRPPDVPWFVAKKVAEHQPEYLTLPALLETTPIETGGHGAVVSVWEPSDFEMEQLAAAVEQWESARRINRNYAGGPHREEVRPKFTLTLWTFGRPLQPIHLVVGERSEAWFVREGEPQSLTE